MHLIYPSLEVSCLSIKYTEHCAMGSDTDAALRQASSAATPPLPHMLQRGGRKSPCVATYHLNKELVPGL